GFGTGNALVLDGKKDSSWVIPISIIDPWVANEENFSAIYLCLNPASLNPADSLWLTFDLKQLYKDAAANTNLRITVNGQQLGATYRPPFSGGVATWRKVKVNLGAYRNLPNIQIGLESSVMEEYANGTGTANLIDNLRLSKSAISGQPKELLQSQLSVFPNPSAGIFQVNMPQGIYQIEVQDLTGRSILKQTTTGAAQLNLNQAAKGIYLLKVTSEAGIATKRLVVQ
ncbi:MAG TPA: T9SS type A sorting domain-containing protein, partial [Adhaeribacter sp.]|nr:T9SS type A sorting domain-containing protein [Adhaeribacter sp.]